MMVHTGSPGWRRWGRVSFLSACHTCLVLCNSSIPKCTTDSNHVNKAEYAPGGILKLPGNLAEFMTKENFFYLGFLKV